MFLFTRVLFGLCFLFFSQMGLAQSYFDREINGVKLVSLILKQGVPEPALRRALEFLDINQAKSTLVASKIRPQNKDAFMAEKSLTVKSNALAIIDYGAPSSQRRFYLIDLATGVVRKYYVAHGTNSGFQYAEKFSNIEGSKMSSLGMYLAGNIYYGSHGQSLNLHGLEESNSNAAARDIVMHSAYYVSEDYIKENGRLGRSWGCPAVGAGVLPRIMSELKEGGLIYAYHHDLMVNTVINPRSQEVKKSVDIKGEELPDEGGDAPPVTTPPQAPPS